MKGADTVPRDSRGAATPIRRVLADPGYARRPVDWTRDPPHTTVETVGKPADQRGVVGHPHRPVVERALARITAHHHLPGDYETLPSTQHRRTFNTPDHHQCETRAETSVLLAVRRRRVMAVEPVAGHRYSLGRESRIARGGPVRPNASKSKF
ncbi:hypothetical protein [Micromonospora sp. NPDC092111]|uniref:hypothetical protein n=1 Tax=Micromonospora sp. NPDC092111 TaxID=3364289 RepID=UPI0037F60F56